MDTVFSTIPQDAKHQSKCNKAIVSLCGRGPNHFIGEYSEQRSNNSSYICMVTALIFVAVYPTKKCVQIRRVTDLPHKGALLTLRQVIQKAAECS